MKVKNILIITLGLCLSSPSYAERTKNPVLAFEEVSIPTYNTKGVYEKDIAAEALGEPQQLVIKGHLDNGLLVVQQGESNIFIDAASVKLVSGYEAVKISVKCLSKNVNRPIGDNRLVGLGFGECK